MAEYYPLLARAVAGLKTSTPQARRAIYERARGALLAQLRAMNPPIPEPDIQRESDALDAAIARLEAEHAASSAPEAEAEALRKAEEAAQAVRWAEARAAQDRAAREQEQAAAEARARAAEEARAAEQARAEAEARKAAAAAKAEEEARLAEAARREEERRAAERAARQHAEQEARLAAEKREREARERAAAEQAETRRRDEIARAEAEAERAPPPAPAPGGPQEAGAKPPGGGATLAEGDGFFPAQTRPGTLAVPVKPPASAPPRPEPPPPPPAPDVTVSEAEPAAVAAPPIALVAAAPVEADRGDPFAAFAADRDPAPESGFEAPELEGDARNRPSRPAAPLPPPERPSHLRHILAGGALALALGGIGYAAWVLRDKAQELPRPKTATEAPATRPAEAGGKIAERIVASPSAPVPTVQAPAQTIRPAGAPTTAPPPPIAAPTQLAPARAAFLIQSDGAEQHKTYSGVVAWRVENGAWRADVSAPEVKLALSFAMTKSADDGPASHKIDLRFQFDDPAYQIGRIGAPELRKEENPYGDRLAAVAVPVTSNVYLIGLRKDEADIAYNLELIRSRGWIDIPIEMADKRIAKVTFEKGPAGEATLAEAMKGW